MPKSSWLVENPVDVHLISIVCSLDRSNAGFHSTTSQWDPNPKNHATIRLSNAELRERQSWYILHWRPSGPSIVAPEPDNQEAYDKRKEDQKRKKQKQGAKKGNREKMILKAEVAWDLRRQPRQLFDADRGQCSLAFGL